MVNSACTFTVLGKRFSVKIKDRMGKFLFNAKELAANIEGLEFYPMINPGPFYGLVLKYGKRISFANATTDKNRYNEKNKKIHFEYAFCSTVKVKLETAIEYDQPTGDYWIPKEFLKEALGNCTFENEFTISDLALPNRIGEIIPSAKHIEEALKNDFYITQGEISNTNAIELCEAHYLPDCNGNNAKNTYLVTQFPPSPRLPKFNRLPLGFQMEQDEAFVIIGKTPPQCTYFSYQHFFMSHFYAKDDYRKIYARLGDSIKGYHLPLSDKNDTIASENIPFDTPIAIIIANNQNTFDSVKEAILKKASCYDSFGNLNCFFETNIFSQIIPKTTTDEEQYEFPIQFGLELSADSFNFLHRITHVDTESGNTYKNKPSLEVLRITPKTAIQECPMTRPAPLERKPESNKKECDMTTQESVGLHLELENLEYEIYREHRHKNNRIKRHCYKLDVKTWMYSGGDTAIKNGANVLGETNDTLYLQSQSFKLCKDDLIVVYGVNHEVSGKAIYANVSCYGSDKINGIGGVTSSKIDKNGSDEKNCKSYYGSAKRYLRGDNEKFYALTFISDQNEYYKNSEYIFKIPKPKDKKGLEGHNIGDPVFMGFRMYIDPQTHLGPYPGNSKNCVIDKSTWKDSKQRVWQDTGGELSESDESDVLFDRVLLFSDEKHPELTPYTREV